MILAIPVVDGHDLTGNLLESLAATVADPANFHVVIVDNGSIQPYEWSAYRNWPFNISVIRYEVNQGYYTPLKDIYDRWLSGEYKVDDPYIGLIHNDMVLYTHGWDVLMAQAFLIDTKLGLIGLCGSNEIDERGGRGGGTMVNFMGRDMVQINGKQYTGQHPSAGHRVQIGALRPALCLDSLFMMFRADVIPWLQKDHEDWGDITLAHFYDRLWPIRAIDAGFRVGVMGIDNDHLGGMTTTGNQRYADDCERWLRERNIPYENPETEMYLVAERRYLGEYRDEKHWLPASINNNWEVTHAAEFQS